MADSSIKAMMLPFERGLVSAPEPGRGFFIRADADPAVPAALRRALRCEQTFKPAHDRLVAAGFETAQRLAGQYDLGLCRLSKHKQENLGNIARAWELLAPGGVLVCGGTKDAGAASIENQVAAELGLSGNLAKFHCRVFWINKPLSAPPPAPASWLALNCLRANVEGHYLTRPGMFSWDKVDEGSRLLIDCLPDEIVGDVADLGAGWGYLSLALAIRYPRIEQLDLYEAELLALDAARANFALVGKPDRARFFWHDVAAGLGADGDYDLIVTNPPFHSDKVTDIQLGRAFIQAAAQSLKVGGRLLLVANRQLPYEATLTQNFSVVRRQLETTRYKIIFAQR